MGAILSSYFTDFLLNYSRVFANFADGLVIILFCIWSEWRLTVITATVRIALVDILDLSEVCLLYTSPSPRD